MRIKRLSIICAATAFTFSRKISIAYSEKSHGMIWTLVLTFTLYSLGNLGWMNAVQNRLLPGPFSRR